MKKIFLIPLMAMLCTVMAWGTEIEVSDFASLKAALSSGTADVVKMTQDIAYPTNGSDLLNITRSVTLDGQGHKIIGWGTCNSNHGGDAYYILTPLAINYGENASNLDVTLENISMSTVSNTAKKHEAGLIVMDQVAKLTLRDCDIRCHNVSGAANPYGIAFYGETTDALDLDVENSFVSAGASGYAFTVLKPIDANLLNSTLEGYSSVTFYAPNAYMYAAYKTAKAFGINNSGSRGTTFYAKSCDFNAPNIHSGVSNAYATFAIQDDGINLTLDNCGIDATQLGDQQQWGVMLSPWTPIARRVQNVNIEFTGDNAHINGTLLYVRWLEAQWDKKALAPEFDSETYAYWGENGISLAGVDHSATRAFSYTGNINVTISGGTYAQNVGELQFPLHVNTAHPSYNPTAFLDADNSATQPEKFIMKEVTIPDGYEVQKVKQGNVNLYRVVKAVAKDGDNPLYDLNDNVEDQGAGKNATTSFELSDGSDMTLGQQTTTAGNVQIKDNGTDGTTVTIGTNTQDQTLIINNGLSVEGNSQVVVETGSNLIIGEGGITTEDPANIVIETSEEKSGSLLLDPTITVNQNPNLTVKMVTKVGYEAPDYYWHRFALPVMGISTWEKLDSNGDPLPTATTYIYSWDYNNNDWQNVSSLSEMQPFYGYNMTHVLPKGTEVTYVFKGNLVGNVNMPLNFTMEGYNFFGNSYTAYIETLTMIEAIAGSNEVAGTVWVWGNDVNDPVTYQQYVPTSIYQLRRGGSGLAAWQKEIAPMQTFILQLRQGDPANVQGAVIDYTSAIWNNPRYNTAAMAPVRATVNEDANVRISVIASNGKGDRVDFTENVNYSDGYENDADATKYMNNNRVNLYSTINDENYSVVVTDNISGKTLSLQTTNDVNYTMLFSNVEGTQYAIRDLMTNIVTPMTEGNTYAFAAQPNSTIEGRFVIVPMQNMPTDVETVETTPAVKGIYTIMGQYVGEDFESLPAGVYVVDGVKIVK